MECRWVVAITLWTMLAGPVFVGLSVPPPQTPVKAASQPAKAESPTPRPNLAR